MKKDKTKNKRKAWKNTISVILIVFGSAVILYVSAIATFFFVIPALDSESQKVESYYGYSHPMNIVTQDDDAEYIFAYYTSSSENVCNGAEWIVIDDQDAIRKYKNTFVIYLSEKSFEIGAGRDFFIFKDGEKVYGSSLCYFPYCMIYDDFFKPYEKRLTVEEMKQYAVEHELDTELFS